MIAVDQFNNEGVLKSDGMGARESKLGGGSGGGIQVFVGKIDGSGSFSVQGGNGGPDFGGGGGGG